MTAISSSRKPPITRRLLRLLVASVAVAAVAGCSNDDDAGNSTADSTVGSPATQAAAAVVLGPTEGQALMQSLGAALTVIDVRTPAEFANGHIDGAVNLDLEGGGFSAGIAALDHGTPYLVYCQSGRRSAIAAETMVAAGFTQVYDMGGLTAWQSAGLPVVAG
ncbi:MAG: rhodanese-like domain-containing protein [Acidimicrobiaceae bacterium]|nr:rhodanese-like domain-containing protein [Acidimicrobiaceae bacterium]